MPRLFFLLAAARISRFVFFHVLPRCAANCLPARRGRTMNATQHAIVDDRYSSVAIALHWLLAIALLLQIGLGWYLGEVPRNTPARTVWVNFHKSIGVTLGVLILFRLAWRLTHPPPALPRSMPRWERGAAHVNHILLYVCMVGMPLTGYVATNFSKFGIKYFGLVELKPWGIDDKAIYAVFNSTHKVLALVFVALIALHIAAAAKHVLIDRDGVMRRMWAARKAAEPIQTM
jgi:cytochrome b561